MRKKCPYLELFWSSFFLHFPAFGLNTVRYSLSLRIQSELREDAGKMHNQNNSEYGHFLRSDSILSVEVLTVFFTTFDHFYHLPIVEQLNLTESNFLH